MESLLSTCAFIYAFNKIRPGIVIDKIIEAFIDIVTPGRGAGESTWWMRGLRSLEQNAEKIDRELRIRSELRKWDEEFPYFHHEMVVRYAAGFLASSAAMLLYGFIRGHQGSRRTRRD